MVLCVESIFEFCYLYQKCLLKSIWYILKKVLNFGTFKSTVMEEIVFNEDGYNEDLLREVRQVR